MRDNFFYNLVHFVLATLVEILIVFWTRKGKSLNFFQLFSMLRE